MFATGMILLVVCVLVVVIVAGILIFKINNGVLAVVLSLVWTLVAVFCIRAFVLDFFVIPTGSMLPTIELQDHVFGNRLAARFGSYAVGDIITFDNPDNPEVTLIKRIVADEGQTVSLKDGHVYVDGQLASTDSFAHGMTEQLSSSVSFPLTVPKGCVFVMGDNRESSGDSRVFGPVSKDTISSVVFCRCMPFDRFGPLN